MSTAVEYDDETARGRAIRLVEEALQLCDRLALEDAAIHLQMGLDMLTGWQQNPQST